MSEKNLLGEPLTVESPKLRDFESITAEIKKQVHDNRRRFNDADKSLKDFRRIFDAKSALMNQAIFNDYPSDVIKKETVQTIAVLVEILARIE